jgi:hypothetical protein
MCRWQCGECGLASDWFDSVDEAQFFLVLHQSMEDAVYPG